MRWRDAKLLGETRYQGKICLKHVELKGLRLTTTGHCTTCARDRVKLAQKKGGSLHEQSKKNIAKWMLRNKERVRQKANERAARPENREKARLARIKDADKKAEYVKIWEKANRPKRNARQRARTAAKLQAVPEWGIDFYIQEAYSLAKLRTMVLDVKYHVDHIVPLKSKLVCGLHTHTNLAVIPAKMNLAKSNCFWPDMP